MGADPNEAKDPKTKRITPLAIAINRGYSELAKYLSDKGAIMTAEMFYLTCKHSDVIMLNLVLNQLRSRGFSEDKIKNQLINGKFEKSESTPLIRSCMNGNLEITKYLIEVLNADPLIVNKNDENCLIAAVRG